MSKSEIITPDICTGCGEYEECRDLCVECISQLEGTAQHMGVHMAILEQTIEEYKQALEYSLQYFPCKNRIPAIGHCDNPEITCAQCKRQFILSLFQGERRKEGEIAHDPKRTVGENS